MPTRDDAPLGAPCWIEVFTSDPDRTVAFYGQLFGWTCEANEEFGGYLSFAREGVRVAGGMRNDGSTGAPDGWTVYLATADAGATVAAAEAAGATTIVPTMEVADLGSMAVVADPGGAVVGLWQPGTHRGFGVLAEPGAPAWFELHTRAYDASVAFYRDVLGWDTHVMSDAPEFRYTTLGEGDGALAGVMDQTGHEAEDAPAYWAVYFGTDDTDASVARAVELGATVLMGAEDTPYGRLAVLADPTGAAFSLVQPPASS
jgi:predicted enzyme related to lactoylglutathione lyase